MSYLFNDDKTALPLWGGGYNYPRNGAIRAVFISVRFEQKSIAPHKAVGAGGSVNYGKFIPIAAFAIQANVGLVATIQGWENFDEDHVNETTVSVALLNPNDVTATCSEVMVYGIIIE